MYKIFYLIVGTVIAVNLFLLLIPSGKYNKYVRFVVGLLIILIIAEAFSQVKVDDVILNFDTETQGTLHTNLENTVYKQILEADIQNKIYEQYQVKVQVCIEMNAEKVTRVEIIGCAGNEEIKSMVEQQYDINRDKIVLK